MPDKGAKVRLLALVLILTLGLFLRLEYAWEGRAPVFDAQGYAAIAANLGGGQGFELGPAATQPASNYSPGLPLLVGGLYALAGEDERLARIVLALLGWLAVPLAYLLGRRLALSARLTRERSPVPPAGLVAAGAVAVYPALLEYQGMLMGEPLAATLLAAAVLAMFWAGGGASRPSPMAWLVPGLLLGALVLVRPEYLGITLLMAVVVVVRKGVGEWRMHLAQAAVMLLGAVLVVAPWTVRNAVVLERLVPVSTGGGQVLFAGSYLPSGGDPERVGRAVLERHPGLARRLASDDAQIGAKAVDAALERARLEQILSALAAQRFPRMESDQALARIGRERLRRAISEEPLDYAGFLAAKAWNMWGHGPRRVMERPGWAVLHWTLLALAALGLGVLGWRRRWEALPIAVILAATALIGLLLVASPRRTLVLLPLLAALAGVGATWLGSRIRPFPRYRG